MGKTLYIHIGMPKTGTTAIQKFLNSNSAVLYQKGYIYRLMPFPPFRTGYIGVRPLRNGYFLHGDHSLRLEQGLSILEKWFREKDNILLTDESLFTHVKKGAFLDRLKRFSDEEKVDVRFIAYLRRQDEYLESHFRQSMKDSMKNQEPVTAYIERRIKAAGYEKSLNRLADTFGRESVFVRVYDPKGWSREGSSIFDNFLKAVGLELTDDFAIPEREANTSLSSNVTEIKRIINQVDDLIDDRHKFDVNVLFNQSGNAASKISPDQGKISFLSEEQRKEIMEQVSESNKRLAETYLNTETLFPEGGPEYVQWDENNPKLLKDAVLYYGIVTAKMYEEILELRRRLDRRTPSYWFACIGKAFSKLGNWFRRRKVKE